MVLDKDIHQQNTTERPEINPYICRRLISDKCAKNKSWRKQSLQQVLLRKLDIYM